MKLSTAGEAGSRRVGLETRAGLLPLDIMLPLLLALVALAPRLAGLSDFLTTDEAYHWIDRTERFSAAIGDRQWAATIQAGHPGVSLMWLGSLGLQLERFAVDAGWIAPPARLEHLAWLRLAPAACHALVLSIGYLLLRRLVRPSTALVAAVLWATSPYLVAHGRLLHLDALLTDFVSLALLATLVAALSAQPARWLIGAGVATGLALLTKGPALVVLPVLGLLLFFLDQGARPVNRHASSALHQFIAAFWFRLWRALGRYALLLAVAAAVVFALWPALWTAPELALGRYVDEIISNGGRPNGDGQFFLGRAIGDPGPWFYLLAGLYRLTPLELLGLLALGSGLFQSPAERRAAGRANLHPQRTVMLALFAFIVFWTLVMTLGPKKFDRYVLPTWPALLILSAAGLSGLAARLAALLRRPLPFAAPLAVALLGGLQGLLLLWYHPYYLSYYNPLLGGGQVARQLFLIGWGEGMERVGAYLRARPDIGEGQVISALPPTLQPFVPVPVQNVYQIDAANPNYAVVYLESLQRGAFPAIYERIRATEPLTTITIHGIDYAWIYQLPRPFERPVEAQFGAGLRLAGISLQLSPGELLLTPAWDVRAAVGGDYLLFVHLLDPAGRRVAQVDVAPGGTARPPTGAWQPGEQIAVPIPIGLPPDLPAGDYSIIAGLYDPLSGARLPLSAGPAADPLLAGPAAALLGTVRVDPERK